MKEFIIYALKSGICISMFYLIYQLLLRKTTFFKFNRYYLMFGFVASLIAPHIHYTYNVLLPSSVTNAPTIVTAMPEIEQVANANYIWVILFCIYITGVGVLFFRNIKAYRRLLKAIGNGTVTDYNRYKLIDNTEVKSPFSFFNYIVIDRSTLSDTELKLIIEHEKAHIYQKHWIDIVCSECMLMLQWFNPLIWIYIALQKENHEFLADNSVIEKGISPVLYQAVLINQQFRGPVFSFSNSFNYLNQLNRLKMIKKTKSSPWKRAAALAILPLFGLFFWASATPTYVVESSNVNQIETTKDDMSKALVIIDGKESTIEIANKINPDNIERMDILKGEEAIKAYQNKGKNGVINITTKSGGDPLYIVDGKESTMEIVNKINPDNIERVEVLKDKNATDKYGEKGNNGVFLVSMKK